MVATLSRRLSPRHYRPMWDEPPPPAPAPERVPFERFRAAFPQLSVEQVRRIEALHHAPDGVVDAGLFGMDYGKQRRTRVTLARHGLTFEAVRLKGYRLDARGRETVRAALAGVPG